ncbi:MAG: hypothetical protein WAO52_07715 [Prolixibacteraceae bacterium]
MPNYQFEIIPIQESDGFACSLWCLKHDGSKHHGPVLTIHGAGICSNIFNLPNPVPHSLPCSCLKPTEYPTTISNLG